MPRLSKGSDGQLAIRRALISTRIIFPQNGDKSNTINWKSAWFHKWWELDSLNLGMLSLGWTNQSGSVIIAPVTQILFFPLINEHFGIPCVSTNTAKQIANAVI